MNTINYTTIFFAFLISTPLFASDDALLGNWGGLKNKLADSGYDLNIAYKGDYVSSVQGGLEKKGGYLGNADITLDLDLEKILSAKGFSLFLYGLAIHGVDPTDYIGDSFATSNIQAPDTVKLYEAFLKYNFNEQTSILLGLRDLNANFYSTASSSMLLNSVFGISASLSQTGVNGPSIFPQTSVAAVFNHQSDTNFYFYAGLFNARAGDPTNGIGTHAYIKDEEGYLNIGEAGYLDNKNESGSKKYGIGAWNYTKPVAAVDPAQPQSANWGLYGLLDHGFTKSFSVFARHGVAASDVNTFKAASEIGFSAAALFESRPDDILSMGYTVATTSEVFLKINSSADNESVTEISYQVAVVDGLSLTPDYQYIVNPGLSNAAEPAHVFSLRLKLQL